MTTELWHELEDKQAERLVGGWQRTTGDLIVGLGSFVEGVNTLTINNKNHAVTTLTVSGERGKFSWSSDEIPNAFNVAYLAYRDSRQVTLIYSEYGLSPHYDYDGDNLQPFYLKGIEFEG
jgi:hypothetical protein